MFYYLWLLYDFFDRKIRPGFKIGKDELVIDIGSGDKPFWRGDVFLDNLKLDNKQRISGKNTVHDLGLFVDSDISKTNFKDKAFDFAFSSHLLEHVEKPDVVINEITRIAKRGYLEVPNGFIESIKPFHSHLWSIFQVNGKLVFVRKSEKMHNYLTANGDRYVYLIPKIHNPFIRIYWQGKIEYEIIKNPPNMKDFKVKNDPNGSNSNTTNHYLTIVKILRQLFYHPKKINTKQLIKHF